MCQVELFARSWCQWVNTHGGVAEIKENNYLDVAEPFAAAFLAGGCQGMANKRDESSFQGVVVLVDVRHEGLAQQVTWRFRVLGHRPCSTCINTYVLMSAYLLELF